MRLLKIVPRKSKSLLEEYFYRFVAVICVAVMILGKAGGLSGYDAVNYRKQQAVTATIEQSKQAVPAAPQLMKNALPPNMKPMIGPQWPVKMAPGAARPPLQRPPLPTRESVKPAQPPAPAGQTPGTTIEPGNPGKKAFVYERPTLPDRKPKLPNNWAGKQDKKPKK
ncbi:MAG: hypothetical protein AUH11_03575 [Acidobacteria bacterium 13_2_20CM_57_17]|nr:MAG: hypothetical protein AUH11_03575 [Acidobacteria bacterium 13_2_20CM_57_17]